MDITEISQYSEKKLWYTLLVMKNWGITLKKGVQKENQEQIQKERVPEKNHVTEIKRRVCFKGRVINNITYDTDKAE